MTLKIEIKSFDPKHHGRVSFRISGGEIAPQWAHSNPWCDCVAYLGDRAGFVGVFGGSVWPAAWPALFQVGKRNTHMTPAGIEALRRAIAAL